MFLKPAVEIVGLASATSANGTARNGATLATYGIEPGSLMIKCYANVKTSSVLATFKVQVSDDGTNWYDLIDGGTAVSEATASGTGSDVETRYAFTLPDVSGFKNVRGVATLSGAATAAADLTKVDYKFRTYGADAI